MENSHFFVGGYLFITMKEINGIVYMYTNKINGKVYIGQTVREKKRKYEHKKANDNTYFHNAVLKYGYENFTYQILFKVTGWDNELVSKVLDIHEKYNIEKYNSTDCKYGYNLTIGGNSNTSKTEYAKNRMREGWNNQLVKEHASEVHKGENNGMYNVPAPNRKKIKCVETETIFDSIKQAAQWLNVKEMNMYDFLSKLRNPKAYNKTYHGYHWECCI